MVKNDWDHPPSERPLCCLTVGGLGCSHARWRAPPSLLLPLLAVAKVTARQSLRGDGVWGSAWWSGKVSRSRDERDQSWTSCSSSKTRSSVSSSLMPNLFIMSSMGPAWCVPNHSPIPLTKDDYYATIIQNPRLHPSKHGATSSSFKYCTCKWGHEETIQEVWSMPRWPLAEGEIQHSRNTIIT
jgi:hypothetical protein